MQTTSIEWTEKGRSLASNGYVLIRVGKAHPLADVRGYAYEHRLVASKTIGRWLLPTEQVHHRNEIKTDNAPGNLEVHAGLAEHRVRHRRLDKGRRLPGEPNPNVQCGCGCGARFLRFDEWGRPRVFVSGHNPPGEGLSADIVGLLERHAKPLPRRAIASALAVPGDRISVALSRLKRLGRVANSRREWRLVARQPLSRAA